ncbi:MAG: 2-oxo acid dehydrogenase subunit E2 [Actinobacteria bacterium]|nr:MAG: 2-oxo acid dehydrogenase subunit E2 [Actinomycetota bacterium]
MAVSVELPRMGESVTEGTIIRWLKSEGEYVEADEPLVEISTDKIDTELPSPTAGVLQKIVAKEEQTVEVGTEIAVIDETASKEGKGKDEPEAGPEVKAEPKAESPSQEATAEREDASGNGRKAEGDGKKTDVGVLSPLVRKLARENDVDLTQVKGTGHAPKPVRSGTIRESAPAVPATSTYVVPSGEKEEVPFSRVRRAIAEHMVRSLATAAHVTNVFEADMTKIAALRERAKGEFKRKEGFSLTFLPFVASAVIQALRAFPEFNAHLDAEAKTATLYRGVNLGIAVGRDEGLIVPVVKGADGMNLVGLARGINDVAARARTKGGLKPDDVSGGTFTITNGGSFGTLIETPIINQPQAAILGTGAVVKRPVVMTLDGSDAVAIRHMMYLYLSYDHRWIDGHKAAQFNLRLKQILEEADFAHELAIEPA